jgi:hypothetical protein
MINIFVIILKTSIYTQIKWFTNTNKVLNKIQKLRLYLTLSVILRLYTRKITKIIYLFFDIRITTYLKII